MNRWLLEELPWLPLPPEDFRAQCTNAFNCAEPERSQSIKKLANCTLSLDHLLTLAKRWSKAKTAEPTTPFTPLHLGLVSNATTNFLAPALSGTALRYGIDLTITTAGFGQTIQEAIAPNSHINQAKPDAILIAMDQRGFGFPTHFTPSTTDYIAEAMESIHTLRQGFHQAGCNTLIFQTLSQPPEPLFGHLDRLTSSASACMLHAFNAQLSTTIHASTDLLFDCAHLAASVGLEQWHDPLQWNLAKLSFAQKFLPLYADHVLRLLAAMRGRSRKCLVLDLDHTLWGGVIGDDGLAGIRLGQGDPIGEAFVAIQNMALALKNRGIVLAVCSKNDAETARLPFRQHPDMVLKESDIAVFMANWHHKSDNLQQIAQQLNIGLDALVLLDDNPVERAQVQATLPAVAVPEMPTDPALFPRVLLAAGYFEAIAFTSDDQHRADHYQANQERNRLAETTQDLTAFLQALEMQLTLSPFDATGRQRITQLINKTNQFNLTTKRYTETEIKSMEQDKTLFTLQARLSDRFGDTGMISIVICRQQPDAWEIDSWLMSCRVMNRHVEHLIFAQLVHHATLAGATYLKGHFIPSPRNTPVQDHYQQLGFYKVAETAEGHSTWRFDLHQFQPQEYPITLHSTL